MDERSAPMHHLLARTSLALALVVGVGALGPGVSTAQEPVTPVGPQPTLTAQVDAAMDGARAELLWDAETARAWVATSIQLERYEGVLKGARGAFLTGRANDADQALLLATLLSDAAIPLRYAMCDLAIADTTGSVPATPRGGLALDHVDAIAAAIDDAELKGAVLALPELITAHRTSTAAAAGELAVALDSLLPTPPAGSPARASTRHVWLQAAHGASWIDLDTTTASGEAPCVAAETHAAPPATLEHRVRIAVEVEQRVGAIMSRTEALSTESAIADLATARIAFGFAEPLGFAPRGPEAVGAPRPYTPMLDIDNRVLLGTPVMAPRPEGSEGGDPGDVIVGIGEELFGSPDPGLAPGPETTPYTGAWLVIELTSPDGLTTRLESEVFDRIGIAARALGATETAPVSDLEQVDGEYLALGALWQVGLLVGETWAGADAADLGLDPATVDGVSGQLDALLRTFPAIRRDLGGSDTIPAVVLAGLVPAPSPDGEPAVRLVFDALHVPGPPPTGTTAAAQDAQAVVGAEKLMAAFMDPAVIDPAADGLDDAPSVFAAARDAGTPLLFLRPGDVPRIGDASPAALARIGLRLAGGHSVLTPATAPSRDGVATTAWWTIDPATGVVRDEHENGRHSTEYTANTGRALRTVKALRRFACKLSGPVIVAAALLFAFSGNKDVGKAIKQVAKTAQAAQTQRKNGKAARKLACLGTGGKEPPK